MTKKEILELIERKLDSNISELTQSLQSYEAASNMDEGDTLDPEDFSQQTEHKEMQMRMQVQLDQARNQLVRLRELAGKDHSISEAGALLETDRNWLFLGISFSAMPVGSKELLGISPESPAFASIRGKGAGDHFQLGKDQYKILAIH